VRRVLVFFFHLFFFWSGVGWGLERIFIPVNRAHTP
jgi:hypothetical protein